jgi:hypothetical protein
MRAQLTAPKASIAIADGDDQKRNFRLEPTIHRITREPPFHAPARPSQARSVLLDAAVLDAPDLGGPAVTTRVPRAVPWSGTPITPSIRATSMSARWKTSGFGLVYVHVPPSGS